MTTMSIHDALTDAGLPTNPVGDHDQIRACAIQTFEASGTPVTVLTYRCDFRAEEEFGVRDLHTVMQRSATDPFLRELYRATPTSDVPQHEYVDLDDEMLVIGTRPLSHIHLLDRHLEAAREYLADEAAHVHHPGIWSRLFELNNLTRADLDRHAKSLGLKGYSSMRRRALERLIADTEAGPHDGMIEPGWFRYGDIFVVPRTSEPMRIVTERLVEAAEAGRLILGTGSANPFGASLAFGDAADLPQTERTAMLEAQHWYDEQMAAVEAIQPALKEAGHRWYAMGSPRTDSRGEVVYYVNARPNHGWFTLDQIIDAQPFDPAKS